MSIPISCTKNVHNVASACVSLRRLSGGPSVYVLDVVLGPEGMPIGECDITSAFVDTSSIRSVERGLLHGLASVLEQLCHGDIGTRAEAIRAVRALESELGP